MFSAAWDESHYTAFLLWDIDREFQNAYEAYQRWLTKNLRKKSSWQCIAKSNKEDPLEKALSLGGHVVKAIKEGRETFGSSFERGDSTCHTILAAQIVRLQHEVNVPLQDCLESRISISHISLPYDDILRAARGIRRACLNALRDQAARLMSARNSLCLPPPRFSVKFCPYAIQLQTDHRQGHRSTINARKVRPGDKYDDREHCPGCNAQIAVSAHSGLPSYRRLLFASHVSQPPTHSNAENRATFACSSCYKTFDESYAFLDHVFQKESGTERSCLRRWSIAGAPSMRYSLASTPDTVAMENDPALVKKCLKNCLQRELTRSRAMKKSIELLKEAAVLPLSNSGINSDGGKRQLQQYQPSQEPQQTFCSTPKKLRKQRLHRSVPSNSPY
ncbi:hypothetical protein DM02DRAFT_515831 [Periconia macrospinosa]|uniref:Uncharacterized protein n=1 Tax=Periconia macrospinosa TaxID=97972 RepID=A0A2V1E876_9PLEO|nr:hypothetical protein DM02DRAFT_515831 [Periconia macrospinosa]